MACSGSISLAVSLLVLLSVCCSWPMQERISNKKLCGDPECTYPILMGQTIDGHVAEDCRFPQHQARTGGVHLPDAQEQARERGILEWKRECVTMSRKSIEYIRCTNSTFCIALLYKWTISHVPSACIPQVYNPDLADYSPNLGYFPKKIVNVTRHFHNATYEYPTEVRNVCLVGI
uniref:Uncharacterized protein n=1 Tax=Eptatretus burgeri TaxID=7764 RepID=A0A8C4WYV6_EPTBU